MIYIKYQGASNSEKITGGTVLEVRKRWKANHLRLQSE
jgi:hypothetical protein